MTIHTEQCKQKQAEYQQMIDAYDKQYPNRCHHCEVRGVLSWYESVDERGGYWMTEPCDHCVGNGKCPQCGEQVWDEEMIENGDHLHCPTCGWSEDNGGLPEPDVPCECEIEEIKKFQQEEGFFWWQ